MSIALGILLAAVLKVKVPVVLLDVLLTEATVGGRRVNLVPGETGQDRTAGRVLLIRLIFHPARRAAVAGGPT